MSLIWLYLPPTMPVSSEYWYINVCGRDSAFTFKIDIIKLLLIQRVLRISSEKPRALQYVEWKWNCYFCTMIADWLVASLQTQSGWLHGCRLSVQSSLVLDLVEFLWTRIVSGVSIDWVFASQHWSQVRPPLLLKGDSGSHDITLLILDQVLFENDL